MELRIYDAGDRACRDQRERGTWQWVSRVISRCISGMNLLGHQATRKGRLWVIVVIVLVVIAIVINNLKVRRRFRRLWGQTGWVEGQQMSVDWPGKIMPK